MLWHVLQKEQTFREEALFALVGLLAASGPLQRHKVDTHPMSLWLYKYEAYAIDARMYDQLLGYPPDL